MLRAVSYNAGTEQHHDFSWSGKLYDSEEWNQGESVHRASISCNRPSALALANIRLPDTKALSNPVPSRDLLPVVSAVGLPLSVQHGCSSRYRSKLLPLQHCLQHAGIFGHPRPLADHSDILGVDYGTVAAPGLSYPIHSIPRARPTPELNPLRLVD